MKRWLLLLCWVPVFAGAQTPPCTSSEACVGWNASTTMEDGSQITSPVTYRVLAQKAPSAPVEVAVTAALAVKLSSLGPGSWCFFVRAIVNGVESVNSNTACKTLRIAAPTDGSIEAPSDGSIEFPK